MASVFLVLSLLVFGAGLVAWAVHLHGVWTREAERPTRPVKPAPVSSEPAIAPTMAPPVANPFAHVGDSDQKDARP